MCNNSKDCQCKITNNPYIPTVTYIIEIWEGNVIKRHCYVRQQITPNAHNGEYIMQNSDMVLLTLCNIY